MRTLILKFMLIQNNRNLLLKGKDVAKLHHMNSSIICQNQHLIKK